MKLPILVFTFAFAASAHAGKCISHEDATAIAYNFLDTRGEKEFPSAFDGKSISEKLALVEMKVAALQYVEFQDESKNKYFTQIYQEIDRAAGYGFEELLVLDCVGRARKRVVEY